MKNCSVSFFLYSVCTNVVTKHSLAFVSAFKKAQIITTLRVLYQFCVFFSSAGFNESSRNSRIFLPMLQFIVCPWADGI